MKRSWDLPQKDLKYYADHLSDIHCVDDPLTTHSGDDFVHDSEDNGGSELEDNAESGNDDDETSSTEEQNEVGMEIEEESDGSWNGEDEVMMYLIWTALEEQFFQLIDELGSDFGSEAEEDEFDLPEEPPTERTDEINKSSDSEDDLPLSHFQKLQWTRKIFKSKDFPAK
ncbi:hypothetical protein JTB14_009746 [Gonioctena quinquepunctata]|nr:hypothetical protein JTB14_009746 [Gonioctena quinquepunctata]